MLITNCLAYEDIKVKLSTVNDSFNLSIDTNKVEMPTAEVYKTGLKKGQVKYIKQWQDDGVRGILDWAIQLNYYRILLEEGGLTVNKMIIQAMCRDSNLKTAKERGIDKPIYLIPINKISDKWIKLYMTHKATALKVALDNKRLPAICKIKERWHNRKCLDYCNVSNSCPYGHMLKIKHNREIS